MEKEDYWLKTPHLMRRWSFWHASYGQVRSGRVHESRIVGKTTEKTRQIGPWKNPQSAGLRNAAAFVSHHLGAVHIGLTPKHRNYLDLECRDFMRFLRS